MSLMDKIRSFFSGGGDSHAGHDHSTEPVSSTAPTVPTDPAGMPTSEPAAMPTSEPADEDPPS